MVVLEAKDAEAEVVGRRCVDSAVEPEVASVVDRPLRAFGSGFGSTSEHCSEFGIVYGSVRDDCADVG